MPKPLRILAHDLDSGDAVLFGTPGFDHVPVTRACIASMAVPPIFSPVRIGDRHYIDAAGAEARHLDVAVAEGASVIVVVNPMVPVRAESVPTGHGRKSSVRDKGLMWVMNQSLRITIHQALNESLARIRATGKVELIVVEPDPTDAMLFVQSSELCCTAQDPRARVPNGQGQDRRMGGDRRGAFAPFVASGGRSRKEPLTGRICARAARTATVVAIGEPFRD
jgi:hypothetical protein